MEKITFYVQDIINTAERSSDPRTNNWPFVRHIYTPLLAICTYVTIVVVGPRIMRSRPAFSLRNVMATYNSMAVLISGYILVKLLVTAVDANYSYGCEKIDHTSGNEKQLEIAKLIWLFYISKYFELLDTVFFILRKKENQISFLHVYHHSSVIMIWWLVTKWVAGGSSIIPAGINSFVHVVMYTYYCLSVFPSLRKYLWWKKYLTQIQMVQFISLLIHCIFVCIVDCGYPQWMASLCLTYSLSLLLLFAKFYWQAYAKTKQQKAEMNHLANGNQIHKNNNSKKFS